MTMRPSALLIEAARFAVAQGVVLDRGAIIRVEVTAGSFKGMLEMVVMPADVSPAVPDAAMTVSPATPERQGRLPLGETFESGGQRVRWFSPTEEMILRAATHDWQTGPQIGEKIGMPCSSGLYTVLGNLAERRALESGRSGYRLPAGIEQSPAESVPPSKPGKKWFSPLEESIMAAATADWQTRQEIADKCGQSMSSSFCAIMANLADREYLESGHRGYRLAKGIEPAAPAPPAEPEPTPIPDDAPFRTEEKCIPFVLRALHRHGGGMSLGEIAGVLPHLDASLVKSVVRSMASRGIIREEGGLYSAKEEKSS